MVQDTSFKPNQFGPEQIDNTVLSVTGATQRIRVQPGSILRIVNTHATATLNINFGSVAVVAVAANDMIILPVNTEYFQVPMESTHMALIGSAALTAHVTKGS